jgi:dephospho-CoA kinase
MLKIALTGGIATGKSHVARKLREAGVPLVDADVLARDAVAFGTAGLAAVVERFGKEILTSEGTLDRARLGDRVFRDEVARRDLEAIIHPEVRRRVAQFFDALPPVTPFAVADIPLLFETKGEKAYDRVVVVACAPETQIARIVARDGLSREAAGRRVAAQMPIDDKVQRADYIIRTDGTFEQTDTQVKELLDSLRS